MGKILLLNGSAHVHGCTATALDEMIKVFEKEGMETKLIQVEQRIYAGVFRAINAAKTENAFLTIS